MAKSPGKRYTEVVRLVGGERAGQIVKDVPFVNAGKNSQLVRQRPGRLSTVCEHWIVTATEPSRRTSCQSACKTCSHYTTRTRTVHSTRQNSRRSRPEPTGIRVARADQVAPAMARGTADHVVVTGDFVPGQNDLFNARSRLMPTRMESSTRVSSPDWPEKWGGADDVQAAVVKVVRRVAVLVEVGLEVAQFAQNPTKRFPEGNARRLL